MSSQWLPLADYSMKHRISVSTLRRKIKAEEIKFRFEDGKYFIFDDSIVSTHPRDHRPSQMSDSVMGASVQNSTSSVQEFTERIASVGKGEPILTAANKLLTELKKAYTLILQEKEEQILHLKEEVTDLKTLVRVLESENARLKNFDHQNRRELNF